MAIKGKKRPMANADVPAKINEQQSKKKVKVDRTKPVEQTNGVAPPKQKKLEKKQKLVVKMENVPAVKSENGTVSTKASVKVDKKDVAPKDVVKTPDDGAKLAAMIKQKAKRKQQRQKKIEGFAPELIKATAEQLQEKIDDIVNREVITRTARRRLAVLKKKLKIKQGTYTPEAPKQVSTMSKNTKRKLRKLKNALGVKDDESETKPVEKVKNKAEKAAKAVKGLKATMAEKKAAQNMKIDNAKKDKNVDKKNKQGNLKMKTKLEKVKVVEKEESEEEDEEEDEDEEQNESMDVSNNSINTDDNEDDEEDEDEEDDDEEDDDEEDDEEVEVKKPISKPKKENKQLNVKSEKKVVENGNTNAKPGQKNQDANAKESQKKTRYVLFVGNIPFTTDENELKKHFLTKVSNVVSVRIPQTVQNKPRGFAYVEFSNSIDFEKGLSLHETQFKGNRIRVQYSGSKNERTKAQFGAKNNKLHALRKQGKLAGSIKDSQKRNARRNKGKNQAV